MSNQGHEVEIREFKEDGLDDTTLKFSSLKQLDFSGIQDKRY